MSLSWILVLGLLGPFSASAHLAEPGTPSVGVVGVGDADLRLGSEELDCQLPADLASLGGVCAASRTGPGLTEYRIEYPGRTQQAWTLDASHAADEVLLRLAVSGGRVSIASTGRDAYITDGARVWEYGGLRAWDRSGRELPTQFESLDAGLGVRVDARGAEFPLTIDPFLSTPDWTVEGTEASSWFGFGARFVGDLDGDGFDDLAIGCPRCEGDGEFELEGVVSLYYGGPQGPSSAADWTRWGGGRRAQIGRVLDSADVNGDGYDDFIVSSTAFPTGQLDGRVDVFHGGPGGIGADPDWTQIGSASQGAYGLFLATGDVDGDGYADLVVSEKSADVETGNVRLYMGSSSGLAMEYAWEATGSATSDAFGYGVGLLDIDGDGWLDLVVGIPGAGSPRGQIAIFAGGSAGFGAEATWTLEGLGSLGEIISTGDIDGDGYDDLVFGVVTYEDEEGEVRIHRGGPDGLELEPDQTFKGGQPDMAMRNGVLGDPDGDGDLDLALGVPLWSDPLFYGGQVRLHLQGGDLFGSDPTLELLGANESAFFGVRLAMDGDVNGDGFDDLLVAASDELVAGEPLGAVHLYLGCLDRDGDGAPDDAACATPAADDDDDDAGDDDDGGCSMSSGDTAPPVAVLVLLFALALFRNPVSSRRRG